MNCGVDAASRCGHQRRLAPRPLSWHRRILTGIMEIAVADERHGELEKQLADNYASAGEYLLHLVEDRKW